MEQICQNLKSGSFKFDGNIWAEQVQKCLKQLVKLHFHHPLFLDHWQKLLISHAHLLGGILICYTMQIRLKSGMLLGFLAFNISIS